MAKAAGDYARMYKPANLKVFPYVRYVASVGSKNPRDSHRKYDGMIFDKRLFTQGDPETFRAFIEQKTGKRFQTIK